VDRAQPVPAHRAQGRAKRVEAERERNQEIRENPETGCDDGYFPSRPPPPDPDDPPPF
jgi:hypothetical protein